MKRFYNNGKLTIKAALYLTYFLIYFILGFSVPIITKYIFYHISTSLIASTTILLTVLGIMLSYMKQSEILIKFVSQNFIILMIFIDCAFLILATIGEQYPEIRFVGYNVTGLVGIGLLKVVYKDNICNCLSKTSIITFDAKCNTIGMIGKLLGSTIVIIILEIIKINVTLAMYLEALFCIIGHALQAYANMRIKNDILHEKINKITFIDVLNDMFKRKIKHNKNNDNQDKIFEI